MFVIAAPKLRIIYPTRQSFVERYWLQDKSMSRLKRSLIQTEQLII